MRRKMCIYKYMLNVYKNQQNRQTGSRNLMGPKTLPMIWGTYMKLVTKYQISVINSCWEKCNEKWAYMFNVYKNQQSRQTGSRNLMGPKTLPTIWGTYMKLVTKYQISAINSCWEKCDEKWAYMFNVYNQRLPGACNRSPGSKLLSITTQLHCGGHLGGRAQLPDTILEEDHPMTIPSKFGSNCATGSRQDGFYVNFP
jgi:hypothetical protein